MRDNTFDSAGKTDRLRSTAPTAAGAAVLQLAEGARRAGTKKPVTPKSTADASSASSTLIPFVRAATAIPKSVPPAAVASAAPLILVAPPVSTSVPDFARQVVAGVVAQGAAHKNITLSPEEADAMERNVLSALDLADLYRLAMGDPAAMTKTAECIGNKLDDAAVQRIMILVCYSENKENADDPAVLAIVTAIVKEIGSAATDTIVWPEPGAAVASYYRTTPRVRIEELLHGTITAHLCGGKLHRDPREGPAREYRDGVRSWSEYFVDDVWHRPASEGPAFVFSHWEGRELSGEEYAEDGLRHRPASDGPALRCVDRAGNIVLEIWCERGLRHRDAKDGPAWRGMEDGCRIKEYYHHGKVHRDEREGPAVIAHDAETGALCREAYFHEGELHRENGPAETLHDPDGTVTAFWYRHGVLHRDGKGGPALTVRGPDGSVIEDFWYRHGDAHREPRFGPAHIWRCSDTGNFYENYYRHGQLHRDAKKGPAVIVRDAAGAIVEQEFWVSGEQIEAPEAVEASP